MTWILLLPLVCLTIGASYLQENTFLEACLENHTKTNLYMDQVDFEPAQNWSAKVLKADQHHSLSNSQTREIFKPPILIRAGGGIHNYLYQLTLSSGSPQMKVERSNTLGKLQITWRTNLGEPGRLQTQQILGNPIAQKEIELKIVEIPSVIILERPFLVRMNLINQSERKVGPFEIFFSQTDHQEEKAVIVDGLQTMVITQVEAFSSSDLNLNLIATRLGVQKISGITVFDVTEKKTFDPLPDLEIFVDSN